MKLKTVDPPQEHVLIEFRSELDEASLVVMPIVGAARVQVWWNFPGEHRYPDVMMGTWDTPPDGRMWQVITDIIEALGELPEVADRRDVQDRLLLLMFEQYGDIYDGCRARLIDRDGPHYNPHANPWWNNARELRERLTTGVYRHTFDLVDTEPLSAKWSGGGPDVEPVSKYEAEVRFEGDDEDEGDGGEKTGNLWCASGIPPRVPGGWNDPDRPNPPHCASHKHDE